MSIILVQRYGVIGVAIATAIPHILVVGVLLPILLPRWVPLDLRIYYLSTYGRPFLAAVPFLLACTFIAKELQPTTFVAFFVSIVAALPLYFIPIWLLALTPDERAAVRGTSVTNLPAARRSAKPSESFEKAIVEACVELLDSFTPTDHAPVKKRRSWRCATSCRIAARMMHGIHLDGPVGLGFRRLSIIDLGGGHQPMADAHAAATRSSSTARSTTTATLRAGLDRQGPRLPDPQRHRGDPAALRCEGRGLRRDTERHVRVRDLGQRQTPACSLLAIAWASSRSTTPKRRRRSCSARRSSALFASGKVTPSAARGGAGGVPALPAGGGPRDACLGACRSLPPGCTHDVAGRPARI